MSPLDLERLIDRELRDLPAPRAPRTLAPRVMEAVRAGRTASPPPMWPRLVAVTAVLLAMAAIPWVAGSIAALERLAWLFDSASFVMALMDVVWRALLEPVVSYAAGLLLLITFFGSAFWAALRFAAREGVSES